MTNAKKNVRSESAKLREKIRQSEKEARMAYHAKKTELEKHYGLYVNPNDYCHLDFLADQRMYARQEQEEAWKEFSEKNKPEWQKHSDEDTSTLWLAHFAYRMRSCPGSVATKITDKYNTPEFADLCEENLYQIQNMRFNLAQDVPEEYPEDGMTHYKNKDGEYKIKPEAVLLETKVAGKKMLRLVEMCLEKVGTKFASAHYVSDIENDVQKRSMEGPIDAKELKLYSAMFDALKVAKIISGQEPEVAAKVKELGQSFLTKEDMGKLNRVTPHFDQNTVQAMMTKYAQNVSKD